MARVTYKGEKLDGKDLTKEDLTNAYLIDCSLVGAKLGNCTNASFVNCDLNNADMVKAVLTNTMFHNCSFEGVKLVDSITAWQRVVGKTVLDFTGFMPVHNNEFYAHHFDEYAKSMLEGELKKIVLEMANDLRERKDFCILDYSKLWDMKWFPNPELFRILIEIHKADPRLWKFFKENLESIYKEKYPEIEEDMWQDSL